MQKRVSRGSAASSSLSADGAIAIVAANAQRVMDITRNWRKKRQQDTAKELYALFEHHPQQLYQLPYVSKVLSDAVGARYRKGLHRLTSG